MTFILREDKNDDKMTEYKNLEYCVDMLLNKFENMKSSENTDDYFKFLCLSSDGFEDDIFGDDKYIVDMRLRASISISMDLSFEYKRGINQVILNFLNENREEIFKEIITYLYNKCEVSCGKMQKEYKNAMERSKKLKDRFDDLIE